LVQKLQTAHIAEFNLDCPPRACPMMTSAMTEAGLSSEFAVYLAQTERLQAVGAVCRNTFIEFPLCRHAMQRRTRSSPPSRLSGVMSTSSKHSDTSCCQVVVPEEITLRSATHLPKRPRWSDADHEFSKSPGSSAASTACSESEHQRVAEVDHTTAFVQAAEDLAALVDRDCGFLRIRSHTIHADCKAGRRSNEATLRFFIQGLPFAKRAKWVQPLLWSVTAVLARSNVKATVKGGELMAVLANGLSIRIDFAAARL